MSDEPLVSVVTPVFNGEAFIRDCIDSVLSQTYRNWEHIIANNCSQDHTLEIVQAYSLRDPRIRVFNNDEFLDATDNGNRALMHLSPESRYCKILHADDWLFPRCLEEMVSLGETHPTVGIVGSFRLRGETVHPTGMPISTTVIPGREACRMNMLGGPYVFGTPSAHLFRSDIIRQRVPFYKEKHIAEDVDACLDVMGSCDFGFVHQVLVYQRLHEDSITARNAWLRPEYAIGLRLLDKYAGRYLSDEERGRVEDRILLEYYRMLGSELLVKPKAKEFWQYHRSKLEETGRRMKWHRVLAGALVSATKRLVRRVIA